MHTAKSFSYIQMLRGKVAGHRAHMVVINSTKSNWQPVTLGIPQASLTGLILFNVSIYNLETVHTLSKFANDTKLQAWLIQGQGCQPKGPPSSGCGNSLTGTSGTSRKANTKSCSCATSPRLVLL